MDIFVNQKPVQAPTPCTLAQLLDAQGFAPPFAAAINTRFVPRSQYADTPLQAGDRVEVIAPVTGG